jgi:Divergent InlB B-repeat domain
VNRLRVILLVLGAAVVLVVPASARALHTNYTVSVSGNGNVTAPCDNSGTPPNCVGGAINCPQGRCSTQYKQGTSVTFTATPNGSDTFLGWGGSAGCSGSGSTCTVSVPLTDTSLTVTASFTGSRGGGGGGGGGGGPPPPPPPPSRYSLTVTKSGTGAGTVVSDPAGIDCGATCSMTSDNGQLIRLTATAAPGSVFKGWTGGCTGATCTPTLTSDLTVTAVFDSAAPVTYALSVAKAGDGSGTVTSSTGGISCGTACSATLPTGTVVALSATPADGSTFTGWSGACTGTGACSLTLSASTSVTATFETVKDTAAPRVVAFASTVKRGKKSKLSYFVSDDSGQSSERILVYNGRKIYARLAATLHVAKAGTVRTVTWKVPKKAPLGKRKWCVTATDASANASAPSCARLTIKR